MKLGARIFLAYVLLTALCFSYPLSRFFGELRTLFVENVEEVLVDQAHILAALVGGSMEAGRFQTGELAAAFNAVHERTFSARIYDFTKTSVDMQVYLTDAAGRIVFDSARPDRAGADYSRWRDVAQTLKGGYGARTTHPDPQRPETSILHVAAPVMVHGRLAGVLTVVKPSTNVNALLEQERPAMLRIWFSAAAVALGLSFLVAHWLTRPVTRLTRYAEEVRAGGRAVLPSLGGTELRDMGLALESMREALEGKKYAEHYVQTLTHEIKSPLSAILGAAELLNEDMPAERRAAFLANIRTEAARIQELVERMLELAALENRRELGTRETVPVEALLRGVLEAKAPLLLRRNLTVRADFDGAGGVPGDPFLLHQALANLVQNAIDFSPDGGSLRIRARRGDTWLTLDVEDEGPGIEAAYADKVFDKFFSLRRPDTGKKSTGLGLNFVREVAQLHGGSVRLENTTPGLRASLVLPLA